MGKRVLARDVASFEEFHQAVEAFGHAVVIYRGQKSLDWPLQPKIGRYARLRSHETLREERATLKIFKERAVPHLNFTPINDWDWLALGQHHGLPTRLLDWSRNPLVSAYFAVEEEHDGDSAVYGYRSNTAIDTAEHPDPFVRPTVDRFLPRHVSPRIIAQNGVFTSHPDVKVDLRTIPAVVRITIKHEFRRSLKAMLYKYGIHRASLFPDLDGLSKHIEWLRTNVF